MLDHPDRGDRVERLGAEVAVVLEADIDLVADAGVHRALAGEPLPGARDSVIPVTCTPWRWAAWTANAPQPQPTSSTRWPARSSSLRHTISSLASWASSSVVAPREKIAQQ